MGAVVLPFFGYIILQFVVTIVGYNVVRETNIGISGCIKSWVFGQMLSFAVLQVMAVPMILLHCKFDVLFWSFTCIYTMLFIYGSCRLKSAKVKIRIKLPKLRPLALFILMITVLLVFYQAGTYFFGTHLDEDDARWLVEANDALEYGDLMIRSYNTGEYVGSFLMPEDVTSPWPVLFAVLSRILFTRVSIIAHTFFPTIEILVVYCIYWLIGKELFVKIESQLTFLLLAIAVILFYGGTAYTQGAFTLVRIWQGKASVAGVLIPVCLLIFIRINKFNMIDDWLLIPIAGLAACLMSGMGIIISGIMIGAYGIYHILSYQHWERIPVWLFSLAPSTIFLLVNSYLRR